MAIISGSLSQLFLRIFSRGRSFKTLPVPKSFSLLNFCREHAACSEVTDVSPSSVRPAVRGLLAKISMPEGEVRALIMVDGTVSLFFSGGGGIVGLGNLPGPSLVARELLRTASRSSSYFHIPIKGLGVKTGEIQFYIFTSAETLRADASPENLEQAGHPLAPLFRQICSLVYEISVIKQVK